VVTWWPAISEPEAVKAFIFLRRIDGEGVAGGVTLFFTNGFEALY
jgi:hypothetical protein